MITDPEYAQLTADVHKVQRGEWLTSDRVADRVDALWNVVSNFGMHGSHWEEAVQLRPGLARQYQGAVLELLFLLRETHDHHVDERAIAEAYGGTIQDVTEEVGEVG